VWSLVDQLVGMVVAHADAQAAQPFPPTPVPGAVVLQPTPVAPMPTPAPLATPTAGAIPRTTLQDLAQAMPTMDDLGMDSPPWALDQTLSGIYTLDQLLALYQNAGVAELAGATQRAAQQSGFIGQVAHLWSTGTACGDPALLDVEIDILLFNDAQGPALFMNDAALQQAWINTGLYSSITPHPVGTVSGQLWEGDTSFHRCGRALFRSVLMPHGRFLIWIALTASTSANPDEVIDIAGNVAQFTASKLDQAGLQ